MREIVGRKIIGFGDSITAAGSVEEEHRWPNIIQELLSKSSEYTDVQVYNAGVGGNTTREGLARYAADVERLLPGLVIVEFGGNDPTSDLSRHVDFEEFRKNMRTIVANVRSSGGEAVLMTFPPVINEWHATVNKEFFEPYGGLDQMVEIYREMTRELAKELNCRLIELDKNLRKFMAKLGIEAVILPDGVHLTEKGNQLIAQIVIEGLGIKAD